MADDGVQPVEEATSRRRSERKVSVNSFVVQRNAKIEKREKVKKVSDILRKSEGERTAAEKLLLKKSPDIVKASETNARRLQATKDRVLEIEDEPEELTKKCDELADLISDSSRIVVYTGAGISTAASIPDYRGPNGVWTLLKKGQALSAQDLSDAEPTFTHMSITKLFRTGRVKHVVSQNCDGLHIRSGYPRYALSEVHGNMFVECCYNCEPHREYIRLFDVTEKTGVRRHTTSRKCRVCGKYLTDTIVHFGEKGKIKSPYRWKEAVRAAKSTDLILCLGSSLKILKRYTCLWGMDKRPKERPKLVIVNLQWTPKDDTATLKINGRCDDVMRRVMEKLEYNVPEYRREFDPIFKFCTPLRAVEKKTTTKKILVPPAMPTKASVKAAMTKTSKSKRKSKQSAATTSDSSTSSPSIPACSEASPLADVCVKVEEEEEEEFSAVTMTSVSVKSENTSDGDDTVKQETPDVKSEEKMSVLKDIKSEVVDCKTEYHGTEDIKSLQGVVEKRAEGNVCGQSSSIEQKPEVGSKASTSLTNVLPYTTSSSIAQINTSVVNDTSTHLDKVFLDQKSSLDLNSKLTTGNDVKIEESPSSIVPDRSVLLSPEADTPSKQDSIGLLLVSQPPECLTDVCSLDLNSENPSVFPVCRIELPVVEDKGKSLLSKASAEEAQQSVWDFDSEIVKHTDVGSSSSSRDIDVIVMSDSVPTTVVVNLEMMESSTGEHCDLSSGQKVMVDLDVDEWSCDVPVRDKTHQVTNTHCSTNQQVIPDDTLSTATNVSTSNASLNLNKSLSSKHHTQGTDNNLSSLNDIAHTKPYSCLSGVKPIPLLTSLSYSIPDHPMTSTSALSKPKTITASSTFSADPNKDKCHIFLNSLPTQQISSSQRHENVGHLPTPLLTSLSSVKTVNQPTVTSAVLFCNTNPLISSSVKPIALTPSPLICSVPSTEVNFGKSNAEFKPLPQGYLKSKSKDTSISHEMWSQSSASSILSSSSSSCQIPSSSSKQTSFVTGKPLLNPTSSSSLLSSLFMNHLKTKNIPKCQDSENVHSLAISDCQDKALELLKNLSKSEVVLRNNNFCKTHLASENMLNASKKSPSSVCEKDHGLNVLKQTNNGYSSTTYSVPLTQSLNSSKSPVSNVQCKQPRKETFSSSNSGVASCVLNMDDLFSSNPLLTCVSEPKHVKYPENLVKSVIQGSRNIASPHGAVVVQQRAFSPEAQKPNEAITLVSKVTTIQQAHCLEHGVMLSENTDIPFMENKVTKDKCSNTNASPVMNGVVITDIANKNDSPVSSDPMSPHNRSDPVSWRCIQKPPNKRSQNRNTIVLKADWGTPLTAILQETPVTASETKTHVQKGKGFKRSTTQENSLIDDRLPSGQINCNDKDLGVPVKKKAKRMPKRKSNTAEKIVKAIKKTVAPKKKKTVTSKKKKSDPANPPASMPGWFGKGLAIKIKRKSKKK